MNNIKVEYWFPTPIWIVDLDIDNESIKKACLKLREDNPEGRTLSNRGGWQSNDLYPEHNIAVFTPLIKKIADCINVILSTDYEDLERSAVVSQYWININNKNDINQVHSHPGSFLSGVYYVSSSEGSGNIHFERDSQEIYSLGLLKLSGQTTVGGINCEYPPIEKRLLIFPGWVPHSVLPNTLDTDRISIAFNSEIRSNTFGGIL